MLQQKEKEHLQV